MFNGQLGLLNKRIKKNFDFVHSFVIVQGKFNYDGTEKEFFEIDGEKIVHIVNQEKISSKANQRNMVIEGLTNCEPEDIIIFSRINEFINFEKINNILHVTDFFPISLGVSNLHNKSGPIVVKYKDLEKLNLSKLRNQRNFLLQVENGSYYET